MKYLVGSTSNLVPYEVVYGLNLALREWHSSPCEITTAIIDEPNYYFQAVDLRHTAKQLLGIDVDIDLVNVALPGLYRHRPLYHVALYHELGHYIDNFYNITKLSLILHRPTSPTIIDIERRHRMEYFADLFAACYTGEAIHSFLENFAPDDGNSPSHPATKERLSTIRDFLDGKVRPQIQVFKQPLSLLNRPELKKRYAIPDVKKSFSAIRPYSIQSDAETHGILDAGWKFLRDIGKPKSKTWPEINNFQAERIINDLIEKSIRNRMITSRWQNGVAC